MRRNKKKTWWSTNINLDVLTKLWGDLVRFPLINWSMTFFYQDEANAYIYHIVKVHFFDPFDCFKQSCGFSLISSWWRSNPSRNVVMGTENILREEWIARHWLVLSPWLNWEIRVETSQCFTKHFHFFAAKNTKEYSNKFNKFRIMQ